MGLGVSGALVRDHYLDAISEAGFVDVEVTKESEYLDDSNLDSLAKQSGVSHEDARSIAINVHAITVSARKPE